MQVLFVRILIVFPYLLFLCPSKAYRNFLQSSISQHNIWLRSKFSSAATCLSNSRKPLKFTNKDQQEDYLRDLSTIDDWILKEGESGIDIFGVVKDSSKFLAWREAEIKHGRLAMLAAFGWPISELYHYKISKVIGMDDLLAKGERAPSVLNGGLDNLYVLIGLSIFLLVGAGLELQLQKRRKEQPEDLQNFLNMWREDGWDAPGNYGFGKNLLI